MGGGVTGLGLIISLFYHIFVTWDYVGVSIYTELKPETVLVDFAKNGTYAEI